MRRSKMIGLIAAISVTATGFFPVEAKSMDNFLRSMGRAARGDNSRNNGHRTLGTIAGTAACAGVGAALGRIIFGRKSAAAQIISGLVGGLFCFSLLTKKDNEALNERGSQLLNQAGPSTETFVAPESGQQVTIETQAETVQQRKVDFQYDARIQKPMDDIIVEARTYVVTVGRLNFRSSPSLASNDNIIGYFEQDANVEVVGYTPDRRWALVGDENVVVGYAAITDGANRLLATPEEAAAIRETRAQQQAARLRNARQRAAALAAARQQEAARSRARAKPLAVNGTPIAPTRVVTTQVSASTRCKAQVARTGDQSVTRKGCELANGQFRFS
jgi:hypothetical protein